MSSLTRSACALIRPDTTYDGKQGFTYLKGISRELVGSSGISMVQESVVLMPELEALVPT